ncbi:hypothetical protein [Jiella marina]|uniref:hypothetical protein n=1 Tax=Jiella sp. LLJ827 TaxID=2917712 RepID=UPI0021008626|nr:hypothetical protein [Jiella sp. LLJ827]MCQ0987556.1 hypothetical protein [Jiella sp. LLJ827]
MATLRRNARARLDAIFADRLPDARLQAIRQAKLFEAQMVLTTARPESELPPPLLGAEARTRGMTVVKMALLVVNQAMASAQALAAAEVERQRAQMAIDEAESPAELDEILAVHAEQHGKDRTHGG